MDWLRSEDLKEEKSVTAPETIITAKEPIALCHCQTERGVPLGCEQIASRMPRLRPTSSVGGCRCPSRASEEEDEEEDEGDDKDRLLGVSVALFISVGER
jgi:hypothetical protein